MPRLTEALMKSKKGPKKFLNYIKLPLYKQLRPAALADKVRSRGETKPGKYIFKSKFFVSLNFSESSIQVLDLLYVCCNPSI